MTAEFESEYNELVSQIMNLPTAVQAVKLLPTAKAALLLNCSVSTLEKRRQSHKPPPPAPNYAGGVKGKECWRRFKIEPPCRLNFEPGLMANL